MTSIEWRRLAPCRAAFPTTFELPGLPQTVSNIGLLKNQPGLLAAIIAVLAGAALIHALVMSVRRSRSQIGVLKSLGFTTGQVSRTVVWHTSLLAFAALLFGIPTGIVAGRLVWRAIVDDLGLAFDPVLPIAGVVVVAGLVLLVANLAALGPGWAAARTRAATALRTE